MLHAPLPPPAATSAATSTTAATVDTQQPPLSPSSTLGLQVLAVEEVARSLLLLLDFATIDGVVASLERDTALHCYLHDRTLWRELLVAHFAGRVPESLRVLALPHCTRLWQWTDATRSCAELREFLRSGDERTHFMHTVSVVRGDIAHIQDINGVALDALAFPTNSHLTNHYIGAAAAVFRRAGPELATHVNDPLVRGRRATGDAVVTPAFAAGVQKLIHCVGPRITQPECFSLLARTYANVLAAVLREELTCVAIASVSTGNQGVPADDGAQVAMRALATFVRSHAWRGALAVVCYDDDVFNAFTRARQDVLDAFNAEPPLPTNDEMRHPWMH